ncbi:MAG: hypothetical protein KatS3mg008_0704 [Acidimicrobiales bacterium]|nr:MAG: hypothetical protein KatS3mg008_0704 [Acidimicrobiales bacterium]
MKLIRVILFPFKLVLSLAGLSLKVGYKAGRAPFVVSARAGRLMGLKGFFFMALGAVVGFFVGSQTSGRGSGIGRLVRRDEALSDEDLAEKVKFELSHAPRTWHLPQPEVRVVSGRVELSGSVPDEGAREEMAKVAASVPGVLAVENRLSVSGTDGSNGTGAEEGASAGGARDEEMSSEADDPSA